MAVMWTLPRGRHGHQAKNSLGAETWLHRLPRNYPATGYWRYISRQPPRETAAPTRAPIRAPPAVPPTTRAAPCPAQMLPEQLDAAAPPIAAPPPAPTACPIKILLLRRAWALAEICLTFCRSMDCKPPPGV